MSVKALAIALKFTEAYNIFELLNIGKEDLLELKKIYDLALDIVTSLGKYYGRKMVGYRLFSLFEKFP